MSDPLFENPAGTPSADDEPTDSDNAGHASDPFCILPAGNRQGTRARVHAWIDTLDPAQTWALSAVSLSRPRTGKQNAAAWRVYGLAAAAVGDRSIAEVVRECKLCYGVPILCAADASYARVFDASIGRLPYEDQLLAMDQWPVTRLMTVPQMSAYIDAIQKAYGVYARTDDGVQLIPVAGPDEAEPETGEVPST